MIVVENLKKTFASGVTAIDALSLEVRGAEICALLGPNGAGKTTTIRVLTTLAGFDDGRVSVAGYNVDTEPARVRQAIGLVTQQTGVDFLLTGRENMTLQGRLHRLPKTRLAERIDRLSEYFQLADHLDQPVMHYSGGLRRRLDIATALIHEPKVLFLDEPTLGLDIHSRKMLWQLIDKLNREQQLTILLTTHYLEEAEHLAHRVAIMTAGKISVIDAPRTLIDSIGGQSLILTLEDGGTTMTTLQHALEGLPFVREQRFVGNELHVYVDNGAESVPKIVRAADELGITLKTLSLARPNLDDVFLKYTGQTLDSDNDQTEQPWWQQWAGKGSGTWQKKWADPAKSDDAHTSSWPPHDAAGENDSPQSWQQHHDRAGDRSSTPGQAPWPDSSRHDRPGKE